MAAPIQRALASIESKIKGIKHPTAEDLPRLKRYEQRVKRLRVLSGDPPIGKRGEKGRSISRILFHIDQLRARLVWFVPDNPQR
jgi:hypothetical protein